MHTEQEANTEGWKTSYSAEPVDGKSGEKYIFTKVALETFQLYPHEAEHLWQLLGKALGKEAGK